MLGPVEGLKVLIEVDATKAQAVLREFSGSVAVAGQTAAAGLSPAEQGVNDLLNQITDTKRRAEELEVSMRKMASGSVEAASGMAAFGGALTIAVAGAVALASVGLAKFLFDAARSTDEMKEATSSLEVALSGTKERIGGVVNEATRLPEATRGVAGLVDSMGRLVTETEGVATGFRRAYVDLFPYLALLTETLAAFEKLAPIANNYFTPGSLQFSGATKADRDTAAALGIMTKEEAATWGRVRSEMESSVNASRRLAEEQKKVAAAAAQAKKEFDESVAHVWRMVEATDKEFWGLDAILTKMQEINSVGAETGGTWDLLNDPLGWNDPSSGSGGYGIAGYLEDLEKLNESFLELGPTMEQLTSQFSTLQETLYTNAQAFGTLATAAIMSALAGEQSWGKALNSIAKQMVAVNLGYMIQNIAMGIMASTGAGSAILGGSPAQFFAAATQFGIAAAAWGTIAKLTGGFGSKSGGGGGGGKGKGTENLTPGPTILPPEREPQITIIIDGNVIGQEEYVRQLALDAAREMKKAGR